VNALDGVAAVRAATGGAARPQGATRNFLFLPDVSTPLLTSPAEAKAKVRAASAPSERQS